MISPHEINFLMVYLQKLLQWFYPMKIFFSYKKTHSHLCPRTKLMNEFLRARKSMNMAYSWPNMNPKLVMKQFSKVMQLPTTIIIFFCTNQIKFSKWYNKYLLCSITNWFTNAKLKSIISYFTHWNANTRNKLPNSSTEPKC